MKVQVHPSPHKRNITTIPSTCRKKKLRRLPHIFSKVLELPFYSETDVSIHETSDSFKFIANTNNDDDNYNNIGTDIGADTVEICPGVIKVVVRMTRGSGSSEEVGEMWRFSDGEVVVIVPKVVDEVWSEGLLLQSYLRFFGIE